MAAQDRPDSLPPVSKGALNAGQQLRAHLVVPESHRYTLSLRKGDFAQIEILQQGIDVAVTLLTPSGTLLREINGTKGSAGTETVRWQADADGTWAQRLSAERV